MTLVHSSNARASQGQHPASTSGFMQLAFCLGSIPNGHPSGYHTHLSGTSRLLCTVHFNVGLHPTAGFWKDWYLGMASPLGMWEKVMAYSKLENPREAREARSGSSAGRRPAFSGQPSGQAGICRAPKLGTPLAPSRTIFPRFQRTTWCSCTGQDLSLSLFSPSSLSISFFLVLRHKVHRRLLVLEDVV